MNASAEGDTKTTKAEDSAQLLEKFRLGDRAAGYELLGRQASIEQWKAVLSGFAADASSVDLERIAGSTLGRHPDVVVAFLDLVEASGTAQALFIAHAATALRSEPHVVKRASEADLALSGRNAGFLDDGDDESGLPPLYTLLCQSLPTQQERWLLWREALPAKAANVERALEAEDLRLQQLSKERSYRAGSYLHFLRHALADFVLVNEISGPIGRRAFALLQRRVDNLDQQEELLRTAPEANRDRYLRWSLDVRNADVVPRTRFALRMVREYFPDATDVEQLLVLCAASDPDVAVDAATTAITTGLSSRASDVEAARLLTTLDPEHAERLARVLVEFPQHIALGRISPERRHLLFADTAPPSGEFCSTIVAQLLQLPATEVHDVIAQLEEVPPSMASDDAFDEIVRGLLRLAGVDVSYWSALLEVVGGPRLRRAAWLALPTVEDGRRDELAVALIDDEAPDDRAAYVIDAIRATNDEAQPALAATVLAATFDGKLDARSVASEWPDDLRELGLALAEEARQRSDRERDQIEEQLRLGEQAYQADLWRQIEPLISLATARAAGNARLEEGYARLATALGADSRVAVADSPREAAPSSTDDLPSAVRDELLKIDAHFDPEKQAITFADGSAHAAARLRYFGLLEQRAQGGDSSQRSDAERLLRGFSQAFGEAGMAEQALRDLFDGGPLLPTVVQLSPDSRRLLLEAAQAVGFEAPQSWFEHAALGEWLRTLQLQRGSGARSSEPPDVSTLATAFRLAQDASSSLAAAQVELDRQHHTVKEAIARGAASVFEEIDALIDSYNQLWHGLARLGIRQVVALGTVVSREAVDPARHEIVGEGSPSRFVVRSPGIEIDGQVVSRAQLDGVKG